MLLLQDLQDHREKGSLAEQETGESLEEQVCRKYRPLDEFMNSIFYVLYRTSLEVINTKLEV